MSRRAKTIIISVIALIIIIAGLWMFFAFRAARTGILSETAESEEGLSAEANGAVSPVLRGNTPASGGISSNSDQLSPEGLARSFLERYGSYSNQSDFENVEDLYPFMTARLLAEMQMFVKQERGAPDRALAQYQGMSTKVIGVTFDSLSDNSADAHLQVQRSEENSAGGSARVFYQYAKMRLVKSASGWRVDAVEWEQ